MKTKIFLTLAMMFLGFIFSHHLFAQFGITRINFVIVEKPDKVSGSISFNTTIGLRSFTLPDNACSNDTYYDNNYNWDKIDMKFEPIYNFEEGEPVHQYRLLVYQEDPYRVKMDRPMRSSYGPAIFSIYPGSPNYEGEPVTIYIKITITE